MQVVITKDNRKNSEIYAVRETLATAEQYQSLYSQTSLTVLYTNIQIYKESLENRNASY